MMNSIKMILLEKVEKKPYEWRRGQALFNYAWEMFPREANKLRCDCKDCFYDDSKMESFLDELTTMLGEMKKEKR